MVSACSYLVIWQYTHTLGASALRKTRIGPTRFDCRDVRAIGATTREVGVCTHLATLPNGHLSHGRGRYSARRVGMPFEYSCVPILTFCFVAALYSFWCRFCAFPIHHVSGKRRMGICLYERRPYSHYAGTCHATFYACPFGVCSSLLHKLTLIVHAENGCAPRLLAGNKQR